MNRPYIYADEIETYAHLSSKVFMSQADQEELGRILRNETLLRSLGELLTEPAWTEEAIDQQDTAIDILMAALKQGSSAAAAATLRGVVQDRQIENPKMDIRAREQLAGLKAEILYQWSAEFPEMAAHIQSWLPGPVTAKIWSNVSQMQQANLAESQVESTNVDY